VTGTRPLRRALAGQPGRSRPRWQAAAAAATLAGTVPLAAACGGGGPGGSGSASSSSGPATYQQTLAYSQCMQSHGDPGFPGPKQGPGGAWLYPEGTQDQAAVSGPSYNAARKAGQKLQPAGRLTPAQQRAAVSHLLGLARCMRAHGITRFPGPASHGNGVGLSLGGIDPNSPQFQAARRACHMPGP
jgi:hypothetical protein